MKLAIFFAVYSLCPVGPHCEKSQEPFSPSTRELAFLQLCEPYKFHLEDSVFVIWIHRIFSCEFTSYTDTFSTWRLTNHRWGRNSRLGITENAAAWSKWFIFLEHTESEEAMTEKEAIFRNLNDFEADDLHTRQSVTSVTRKQVLERTRDRWSPTKIHYLQVSKRGMLQWRKLLAHGQWRVEIHQAQY